MYLHYDNINKRWLAIRGGFIIATGELDECIALAIEFIWLEKRALSIV
jgi:hypothetical protein